MGSYATTASFSPRCTLSAAIWAKLVGPPANGTVGGGAVGVASWAGAVAFIKNGARAAGQAGPARRPPGGTEPRRRKPPVPSRLQSSAEKLCRHRS